MLSGTEMEIINCVARLKTATREQIRRELDFSPGYMDLVCRYLVRKGYLACRDRHYSLAKERIAALLQEGTAAIDRESMKDMFAELSMTIGNELKKTMGAIAFPAHGGDSQEDHRDGDIKIKTDFDLQIEDESIGLESNIHKIGAKLEREKSTIAKSVALLKRMSQ